MLWAELPPAAAPEDAYWGEALCVRCVWQGLQPELGAQQAQEDPHGRSLRVPRVWKGLSSEFGSRSASQDTHRGEATRVSRVPQGLHAALAPPAAPAHPHWRRPYVCGVCGKAFNHSTVLRSHPAGAHGEKHECAECGRAFREGTPAPAPAGAHRGEALRLRRCGRAFSDAPSSSSITARAHWREAVRVWRVWPKPSAPS